MGNPNKNNLVYFSIGDIYNKQCFYSILTLVLTYNRIFPQDLKVYVYTDDPELFLSLTNEAPVCVIKVDTTTINKWLNKTDFFLRAKICVIKQFLADFPGNMIFVDTDVVFKEKLDATFQNIANGKVVLHTREANLGKYFPAIYDSYKGKEFLLKSGQIITIDDSCEMWNSGLVGISSKQSEVIDDVLELCDYLLPHNNSRLLEQVAFSLVLPKTGNLIESHTVLVHYWDQKEHFNTIINTILIGSHNSFGRLLAIAQKNNPTTRTLFHKFYFSLHPSSFFRILINVLSQRLKVDIITLTRS